MKVKQNIIAFLLGIAFTLTLGFTSVFQFTLSSDTLYVDGVRKDVAIYKYDGSNHLPVRATAEALGAEVEYADGRIDITSKLTDIEAVAAKCKDSCVMIYVYKDGKTVGNGSGFIYNGYIITAKHVTDAGDRFVVYHDDSVYGADVSIAPLKSDLDISALKLIDSPPSVTLGDSDKLKEGQKVIAVTSPAGVKNAVDECFYHGMAYTSGKDHLGISDSNMDGGSSGGAIFDTDGELIGIVIRGVKGNGAAIPVNDIKPILEQLK